MVNTIDENLNERKSQEVLQWTNYFIGPLKEGAVVLDVQNNFKIIQVNEAAQGLTAYCKDQLLENNLGILTGPKTDLSEVKTCHARMQKGESFKFTILHYRQDGNAFWNEISFSPLVTGEEDAYYLLLMKDVSSKKNTEKLMDLERDVYLSLERGYNVTQIFEKICNYVAQNFYKKIHCCIFLLDNKTLKVMTEQTLPDEFKAALMDLDLGEYLANPQTARFLTEPIIIENVQEHPMWIEFKEVTKKYDMKSSWSQPIKDQAGNVVGVVSIYFQEVVKPHESDYQFLTQLAPIASLAMKYLSQKDEIIRLAYFDDKTGLRNYSSFEMEVEELKNSTEATAIFIIEPSEYHTVVDLYKRSAGDSLLKQLAERLQLLPIFEKAIIARYTSSALIAAVPDLNPQLFQDYIVDFEQQPFYIDGKGIAVTLKVGTSLLMNNEEIEQTVQRADIALNTAMKIPGSVMQYFDADKMKALKEDMEMTQLFLDALKNKEIFAMLQPKINLKTGQIEGFEALARWNSKELGTVSPLKFIALAEKIGKIYKVDRAILRDVLKWQKRRKEQGKKIYPVAVNISAVHFYYPLFMDNIKNLLAEYDADPNFITFEITESIELENVNRAKSIIKQLNDFGISVSIDDFGVGYSSLGYLQELPFEEIKIDKSFTDSIMNPRMKAVLKTIVQLSQNLEMKSVAEGVETENQHDRLLKLGCHIGQGYYYFRPMPIKDVDVLLESQL